MGGKSSKIEQTQRANITNLQKLQIIKKQGNTDIALDGNGEQVQINVIQLDAGRKLDHQQQVYFYRSNNNGPFVKCYGAQVLHQKSTGMCGVQNTMKVGTQRIIKRWNTLPQLAFPQILYSLTQALQGYKQLFKKAGIFQVNQQMLGINNFGDLKVWLNQNFANNHPSHQKGILYTTADNDKLIGDGTEPEMVDNVFKVIEERCEQGKYPQDFSDYINLSKSSFNGALNGIDEYIRSREVLIPGKIHPDSNLMYSSKLKQMPGNASHISRSSKNYQNQDKPIYSGKGETQKQQISNSPKLSSRQQPNDTSSPYKLNFQQDNHQTTSPFTKKQPLKSLVDPNKFPQVEGYYTGSPVRKTTYERQSRNSDLRQSPNPPQNKFLNQRPSDSKQPTLVMSFNNNIPGTSTITSTYPTQNIPYQPSGYTSFNQKLNNPSPNDKVRQTYAVHPPSYTLSNQKPKPNVSFTYTSNPMSLPHTSSFTTTNPTTTNPPTTDTKYNPTPYKFPSDIKYPQDTKLPSDNKSIQDILKDNKINTQSKYSPDSKYSNQSKPQYKFTTDYKYKFQNTYQSDHKLSSDNKYNILQKPINDYKFNTDNSYNKYDNKYDNKFDNKLMSNIIKDKDNQISNDNKFSHDYKFTSDSKFNTDPYHFQSKFQNKFNFDSKFNDDHKFSTDKLNSDNKYNDDKDKFNFDNKFSTDNKQFNIDKYNVDKKPTEDNKYSTDSKYGTGLSGLDNLSYGFKGNTYGFTSNFTNMMDKYSNIGSSNKTNPLGPINPDDPISTPISRLPKIQPSISPNAQSINTSPNINQNSSPLSQKKQQIIATSQVTKKF